MSEDKATPRPWEYKQYYGCIIGTQGSNGMPTGRTVIVDMVSHNKSVDNLNAALIVRAVNTHDRLVKIVKGILMLTDGLDCEKEYIENLKALIAEAERE